MIQEYKCPCCGGAIEFDSSLQKMKCPFCDTEFELSTLQDFTEETSGDSEDSLEWDSSAGQEWSDGEANGLHVYLCSSCGAEIFADDTLASTKCPYCDNNIVLTQQLSGDLKPDCVIPFKLDKQAAMAALKRHYEGKKLLPKVFKDENHLAEIKGVYVPVWLFDTDAEADIRYKTTKLRIWSDARFNYTETRYYAVTRRGSLGFDRVPVDGSTKMPDELMESLEPYDFRDAVDFNTAYLAGYLTDKYDVDAQQSIDRANQRIKQSTEQAFASTVQGYQSVVPEYSSIRLNNGRTRYALYPVWLLNTEWNGEKYTFAMNGQTGKFVGDLPVDKNAYKKMFARIAGIAAAAAFAASYLLWMF